MYLLFQASSNIVCLSQRQQSIHESIDILRLRSDFQQLNALIRYYQGRLKLLLLYVKRLLEYI